jgi:hypothetical protein
MKITKSTLMGTGSVVLAGLILSLLTPKAVHAIAAAAVLVENTTANPVPVQSIMPGKPFVQSCGSSGEFSACFLQPPVPAGYTFVVQYANAFTLANSAQGAGVASWQMTTQGVSIQYSAATHPALGNDTIYGAPVSWYIDSGTTAFASSYLGVGIANTGTFSLTGYLTQ